MGHQVIVGYDVREMWLDPESQWTQDTEVLRQKKDEGLLKWSGLKPYSVDRHIWHSVFSELNEARLWSTVSRLKEYCGAEWDWFFSEDRKLVLPEHGGHRGVWPNLESMIDYIQAHWGASWKPCYLVAIVELIAGDSGSGTPAQGPEAVSSESISDDWVLLGYDVADYDLISGIYEGVMDNELAHRLRAVWAPRLNEHHLFPDPQTAFDYIPDANIKCPSHKPYSAYALYGVQRR